MLLVACPVQYSSGEVGNRFDAGLRTPADAGPVRCQISAFARADDPNVVRASESDHERPMVAVEHHEFAVDFCDRDRLVLRAVEFEPLQAGEQFLVTEIELARLEVVEGDGERLRHCS